MTASLHSITIFAYLDCKSGDLSDLVARQMAALRLRRDRIYVFWIMSWIICFVVCDVDFWDIQFNN